MEINSTLSEILRQTDDMNRSKIFYPRSTYRLGLSKPHWGDPTPEQAKVRDLVIASKAKVRTMNWAIPCYLEMFDGIFMPKLERFRNPDTFYGILLHELGHWTGHKKRIDRKWTLLAGTIPNLDTFQEEITAETIANHFLRKFDLPMEPSRSQHTQFIITLCRRKYGSHKTNVIIPLAKTDAERGIQYLEQIYEQSKSLV